VSQGFDGVPVGSGPGQKGLDIRTERFRHRTKRFRHPPTHPLKCLRDKDFKRVFFNVLSYISSCKVRQREDLYLKLMELKAQSLKELYEKDFYLWVQENLRLLKNREYELVDWENLLEEIEGIGRSLFIEVLRQMRKIMEGLYKWENFKNHPEAYDWVEEVAKARRELEELFEDSPSLKAIAQDKDTLQKAWKLSVRAMERWLEHSKNLTIKEAFPQECPYTFQQIMEYKPWLTQSSLD
jgi:hypothetical protein